MCHKQTTLHNFIETRDKRSTVHNSYENNVSLFCCIYLLINLESTVFAHCCSAFFHEMIANKLITLPKILDFFFKGEVNFSGEMIVAYL